MISSAYLWAVESAISNDINVRKSAYTDTNPYHHTTSSLMRSFLNEYRVISSAAFLTIPKHILCHTLNCIGIHREQHLTLISLHPNLMLSSPPSSVFTVSCSQWNLHHYFMYIHTILMKLTSDCLVWDPLSCYQKSIIECLKGLMNEISFKLQNCLNVFNDFF